MSPPAGLGGPAPRGESPAQATHRFHSLVAVAGAFDPLYRRGYLDAELGIPPTLEISPDYMAGYAAGED